MSDKRKAQIKQYKLEIADIMRFSEVSEYGLTEQEIQKYFAKLIYDRFLKWTDGQTCALTPDHKIVFFPEDIHRFVATGMQSTPDFWD